MTIWEGDSWPLETISLDVVNPNGGTQTQTVTHNCGFQAEGIAPFFDDTIPITGPNHNTIGDWIEWLYVNHMFQELSGQNTPNVVAVNIPVLDLTELFPIVQ